MYQVGLTENDSHIQYFWKVLESFSQEELRRFVKFACNQERIPQTCPCRDGGHETAHVPPYPMKIAPPDGTGIAASNLFCAVLLNKLNNFNNSYPVLRSLHWLPIKLRIQYKLYVLMHQVHIGRSPAYLADMMKATADLPGRERLRSANSFQYETPKLKLKFGERGFSYVGPKAWNSLPSNLQELMNTDTFKKQLKTHLFKLAYE